MKGTEIRERQELECEALQAIYMVNFLYFINTQLLYIILKI